MDAMKKTTIICTALFVTAAVLLATELHSLRAANAGDGGKSLFAPPKAARAYWPTDGWRVKRPEDVGMSAAKLKAMDEYAFTRVGPEAERRGIRTDGLVIIKNGYLVFEKYAGGFNKDRVHLTWSVSKSFTNALYGIAVKEGRLKVEDPAYKYYKALDRGDHRKITIDHLLRMSSGLYSNETYEASPLKSTVNAMLFTTGHKDMAAYAAAQDFEAAPGEKWEYASPTPNLLMAMLKNTMTAAEYDRYPWDRLFNVIGMKNAVWERDAAGTFVGSSYVYATPRDMAKFGYLFLNDGMWEGRRVLPEGWVRYSTTLAPAYIKTELDAEDRIDANYGALWWLNMGVPEKNMPPVYPDAPRDMFMATGHWSQMIFVIPSLDMVIAYTGDTREKSSFSRNRFLKLIIDSIEK
jgi:CubicO group peptidase (beta-lactamase class C family)